MSYSKREIPRDEIDRQRHIMARVRESFAALGAAPLALVDTYGCQQNEADSEKLRGMLLEMGYGMTTDEREADVIVFNTCAVREHAEMRVFGNLGALTHTKREKPDQIIALCGCMAQEPGVAEKVRRSYRHVDLVFGVHSLWKFPELLERVLNERRRVFCVEDSPGAIAEGLPVNRNGRYKAWLPIMYGCDNFCSYCIVPYVRGRERSRAPEAIAKEAEALIRGGCRDITLLGQNVNSYGNDLSEAIDFPEIIQRIDAIDGEFLIRFMTSHPKDASEKLFCTMAGCQKAARHIHLPFQAGSDRVLRAMNRGYTKDGYLKLTALARQYMPDIVITSDVIVGFPGETYADFKETLDLIERARFDALFTFLYSPRPGTPASELPDPVTRDEKQRWFDELLTLQNSISEEKHAAYVGKTLRALVDGASSDGRSAATARTNGGRLVNLYNGAERVGSFCDVKITGSTSWALWGEVDVQ